MNQATELSLAARQEALLQSPPRKVVVATICTSFDSHERVEERIDTIDRLLATAGAEARRRFPTDRLDLCVLPEEALRKSAGVVPTAEKALRITDKEVLKVALLAAREQIWLVLPLILAEEKNGQEIFSNAAVLLDRTGKVAGIYRKVHPIAVYEDGVTPGSDFPVFTTDFGKVGVQICWDMSYEEGWKALASSGAEIVALPSMSPQNVRLASYAQRFRYWIVNSTPRDNATIFNPIGLIDAQINNPGVLVHRFDLVSAVVHWNAAIDEGRAFQKRFGNRGGYVWSFREDTGLFWSNDPHSSVGAMLRELGAEQMDAYVERMDEYVKQIVAAERPKTL